MSTTTVERVEVEAYWESFDGDWYLMVPCITFEKGDILVTKKGQRYDSSLARVEAERWNQDYEITLWSVKYAKRIN